MNAGLELFKSEARQIKNTFHSLSFIEAQGIVAGELILADKMGIELDKYLIEIHPVSEYPQEFPRVFEVGGRIPRNIDWHVFESDGHCCLMAQPDQILVCKEGITLATFIENQVKPYFFNQLHREMHGYFLKERSHGLQGELEFFFDLFRTKDLGLIYRLMAFVAKRKEPGRTEQCFCGSKQKYRRCHRDSYRVVSKFTDVEIHHFIKRISETKEFRSAYH